MRDDREVDAQFYMGAPNNERERERAAHAARSQADEQVPAAATPPEEPEDDVEASTTGSAAEPVGTAEADDELGEGRHKRRAA
jgi:hypothetical protein